ncbi:hypothetical protein RUM44_012330 [Polyplax serrata]|uniref:Tetratricopeptide repeat protein n=1 Tax=Polyplax serrata TaxID=468196 RepID=A0ABR1BEV2_POLSC
MNLSDETYERPGQTGTCRIQRAQDNSLSPSGQNATTKTELLDKTSPEFNFYLSNTTFREKAGSPYGNLGSILNAQGRGDEAEAAYRMALKHRPNMAEVYYNL